MHEPSTGENGSTPLPTLSPNDHLRLLAELLRPGGADLARRWVAALLVVPPEEREALVGEVERRVGQAYGDRAPVPLREAPGVRGRVAGALSGAPGAAGDVPGAGGKAGRVVEPKLPKPARPKAKRSPKN